jgi:hypothetical protein
VPGYALNIDPLPSVSPIGAPGGDFERIEASPEMFGGAIARALGGLGHGVEAVGNTALEVLRQRQELTNEIGASETNTWLAKAITDRFNDFGRLQGRAAQDALPKYKQDIEDLYQQSLKSAGDNLAMKAMLARSGRYLTDAYYRYGTQHADSQWRQWQDKTAADRAAEYGNQAAIAAEHGTWDDVAAFLHTSDDEISKRFEAQGWQTQDIAPEIARNRGRNVRNIVETLAAQGDFRTAQAVYDRYQDGMDAASRLAAVSRLRTANAQIEGHRIADEETGRALRADAAAFLKERTRARIEGLNPDFAGRLVEAARDFEAQTGGRAAFESLKRTTEEQAEIYERHLAMPGGVAAHPAAPPGRSRHERGEAADIPAGPFRDWLHENAGRYGLEFLKGETGRNDPGHVQLAAGPTGPHDGDRGAVFDRIVERTKDNPLAQSYAVARMNQIFAVARDERVQGLALFNRRLQDTTIEAMATGTVREPLTEDDFFVHRKPGESADDALDRYQSYLADLRNGADRHAMDGMSTADMRAMIAAAEPRPDVPGGMTRAVERQAFLIKTMEEIEKKRRDDPAGAVAKSPAVIMALQQYDPQKPETFRSVADARLAAQAELGIPPEERSAIAKDEALEMIAPVWRALPGQERAAVVAAAARFETMFGPAWPQAFTYALRAHAVDAAVKEAAVAVIRKWLKGQQASDAAARAVDQENEIAAADAAVRAMTPAQIRETAEAVRMGAGPFVPADFAQPAATPERSAEKSVEARPVPPAADIIALRRNPALGARFDEKYGKGAAKQILERYPLGAGDGGR